MRIQNRPLTVLFSGMLVALTAASLTAQAPRPSSGQAPKTPRTADGHPDLQGFYDVATVTPLERPAEAGGRLVISNEEAAAAEAYDRQREAKDAAPIAGDRGAPQA